MYYIDSLFLFGPNTSSMAGASASLGSSFALAVRYGEACDCSAESPWGAQHCCDSGLVCSRSSKTCKPALGKQCTPSWIPGYTDCAKSTYNADIKCKPYADKPEKGWCCIKTGSEVPRAGLFSEPCCDGHTRWKGAKMYCSDTAEE